MYMLSGTEIQSTGDHSEAQLTNMDNGQGDDMFFINADNGPLLSRAKRDLKWEDVEKFYEDKNNFAMFLVLPIIVIVYGGCAVIYCIARCRRYAKRRKRKTKSKEALSESDPLENPTNIAQPGVTTITNPAGGLTSGDRASTASDVFVKVENGSDIGTPLPWQVPGESQYDDPVKPTAPATVVTAAAVHQKRQPLPNNQYVNSAFEDDFNNSGPPPYEESMNNYNRPISKPPPYDKKRRESVEEIITLDPIPAPNNANERKRRRSGGAPATNGDIKIPPPPDKQSLYDEERERARALIRGDRPKRDIQARDRQSDRERTPDIISHARTRPLEPRYTTAQEATDPVSMARQAAQLLRLDHLGKQQGKKQKRLVFVAE